MSQIAFSDILYAKIAISVDFWNTKVNLFILNFASKAENTSKNRQYYENEM